MVRKAKEKDKITGKAGECHLNVKIVIDKLGGSAVSGWLLSRIPNLIDNGMYLWNFHSVWMKPDGKLLDVTDDKYYIGREKSIFVPDATRKPDLLEGLSYNSFVVFTEGPYARQYGDSIGMKIITNKPYWADNLVQRLLEIESHSGEYRLVTSQDSPNYKRMCDEYEIDFINGTPVPRPGSKYENTPGMPLQMLFDYSVGSRA